MYTYEKRVAFSELAEDKKASLVSVVDDFQNCCTFEAEDNGIGLKWLDEHHTAWMLANWQIKVLKYPYYGEYISVSTWAYWFRAFMGRRNFTIKDRDTGELLAYADSDWAYVNVLEGKPEPDIPQKEIDVYGIAPKMETDFRKRKIKLPDEMKEYPPITVTELFLDTNHHVNNAQYLAIAQSVLPPDSRFSHFHGEYKLQSVLGDVLVPFRAEKKDGYYVVLKDPEGRAKLITEFTN